MTQKKTEPEAEACPPETSTDLAQIRTQRQQFSRMQEAFQAINEDPALARAFSEDPLMVMKKFDVNTRHLKIHKSRIGDDLPTLDQTGIYGDKLAITVCASIGFIVCATVGDDF